MCVCVIPDTDRDPLARTVHQLRLRLYLGKGEEDHPLKVEPRGTSIPRLSLGIYCFFCWRRAGKCHVCMQKNPV